MRLIYNLDAQRLQKNFDDKTPVTVSELFRSERTASVPIELFLVDNDGGYATPGSSDYEVLIGRQAQAVTTGKLTLTFTGTTEEIDLSKPKLATRIEAALNAVSEVNAAGGVDVVELKNGRAFQITFRSVGSRTAITAGVKDSMQPASVLISEVTAGTGSTREVQLLTLEEASLAEVSTSGWSTNSNPALTITTLVEGTANTREVVQLSVSNDPAPGSFFVVSNSEPISTEATAAQVKTILNSALSNDIGSVKKTGERIWQITYKTNGDKTALSAGTHNLVKRPSVNATLSLNTTALAYAANSDGSDLSVGFTLKKSNEVLLSENVDLAEPFAEVIGSSAMLNNDSLGALFTIAGDEVNKGTAISLSGGLTYSSDTLAAPFLPLAGGTMTGDALFGDNVKAKFGTDSDLEIHHTGSSSVIHDRGTGGLKIDSNYLQIRDANQSETLAKFTQNGAVELYYNSSKKFETSNEGVVCTGLLQVNGSLNCSGTLTTFDTEHVVVTDPIISLGGTPTTDSNKDVGMELNYYNSGSAKKAAVVWDDSEQAIALFSDATNSSEVFSGTLANLRCGSITGGNFYATQIRTENGSASFPSHSFTGDSNSGIFGGTDIIGFSTGGTEAARFDSDGTFEIKDSIKFEANSYTQGTGTIGMATNNILYIRGGSSGTLIQDNDGSESIRVGSGYLNVETGSTNRMRINSTGVGISNTSPDARLDVQLESGVWDAGGSFSDKSVRISGGSGGLGLAYDDTTGATIAAVHHGNSWKKLNFAAVGYIYDINGSEAMRLNTNGLGIGYSSPSHPLHVRTEKDGNYVARITNTEATAGSNYGLKVDGGSNASDISFEVANYLGDINLRVTGDGKVGIGGVPSQVLHVSTSTNYQGLLINGNVAPNVCYAQNTATTPTWKAGISGTLGTAFSISQGSANTERLMILDGGDVGIAEKLYHLDDDNTYFEFNTDQINLATDGIDRLRLESAAVKCGRDLRITQGVGYSNFLLLSHNDSNAFVKNNFGDLYIENIANGKDTIFKNDNSSNIAIELLRLDGSASSINVPDEIEMFFGSSSDFSIKHGPNNTHQKNFTGDFYISNDAANKDLIFRASDGTLNELMRLDGSTSSINIPNDIQLRVGNANDIRIVSESSVNRFNFYNHDTEFRTLTDDIDIIFKTTTGGTTSEVLRLDGSTGNVGIGGVTSPATKLVIDNGGIGTVDVGYSLAILGDGIDGVQIISSSSQQGRIVFGDDSHGSMGRLNYDHSNDSMSFVTNGSERMRIDSSGNVGISTTSPDTTLSVNGGVSFRIAAPNNSNHTITNTDYCVFMHSLTASRTVSIPTTERTAGRILIIKDRDGTAATHNIVIDPDSTVTIDGSSTYTISTNYQSVKLISDGSNWFVID